jgi:hypothetical protein
LTSHRAGLCFSLKTATTLSHTVCHFLQIGEGREQFQPSYGSLRGDDHPVDHFMQQFLLTAAFQPAIQYTHFCNNRECRIQIGDVDIMLCLQRLQRMTQGAPSILPLRPQVFPDTIRDFTGGVEPQARASSSSISLGLTQLTEGQGLDEPDKHGWHHE